MTWEEYKKEWLRGNTCNFCQGSRMHTCTSYKCQPAYREAEAYFDKVVGRGEVASGRRVYVADLLPLIGKDALAEYRATGIWLLSGRGKKEAVIQFRGAMPRMQQVAHVHCIMARIRGHGGAPQGLLDGARARPWRESDKGAIQDGIPHKWGKGCSKASGGKGGRDDSQAGVQKKGH